MFKIPRKKCASKRATLAKLAFSKIGRSRPFFDIIIFYNGKDATSLPWVRTVGKRDRIALLGESVPENSKTVNDPESFQVKAPKRTI